MSGAATLDASTAILKYRYPDGKLPKALYERTKFLSMMAKREDFTGYQRVVALQSENPQGIAASFPIALGALQQGTYANFNVSRIEYFGVARIKGQALRAAEGDEGALVDLWKNETDGVSQQMMTDMEIHMFGAGDGILGRASSGTTSTAITLGTLSDAAKFALGMQVGAVSATGMSPTVRTGYGAITAIDRTNGTITSGSAWNSQISALGSTDYLVRYGNAAGSSPNVLSGVQGWIPGGSSPGTWYGLSRNTDPVRYAGQTYSATGVPMEEAIIEASALVNQQGAPQPKSAWCHPRDLATFKKSLGAKVTYDKVEVKSTVAGVSFSGIEIEGDEGRITIMTSPFVDRNKLHLLYLDSWKLDSIGPAPHMLDYDGPNFLRVASDDAYECRFGMYGNMYCNLPFANITITSWGA